MVKRSAIVVVAASVWFVADAHAAPVVAKTPITAGKPGKPKKPFDLGKLKKKPTDKVKLKGGKEITVQQYVDYANDVQAVFERNGLSLTDGKDDKLVVPIDASEITAAKASFQKLDTLIAVQNKADESFWRGKLKKLPKAAPGKPKSSFEEEPANVSHEWDVGNTKRAAAYFAFRAKNDASTTTTTCKVDADAGIYLFDKKRSVLKLSAEVRGTDKATSVFAGVYLGGSEKAAKEWKDGVKNAVFSKQFETPDIDYKWTFWGVFSAGVRAYGQAKFDLTISLDPRKEEKGKFSCAIVATPSISVSGKAEGYVNVLDAGGANQGGIAEVAIVANVALLDLKIPTTASIEVTRSPLSFTETLKSEATISAVKGRMSLEFTTKIPIDGEKLFDWDKDTIEYVLMDFDGYGPKTIPLFNLTGHQG